MAKLKSRNRTELWRLERTQPTVEAASADPKNYDCVQETKRYAAMSDGHLLFNLVCVWRDGVRHDYGWKQKTNRDGKVLKYTVEQFITVKENLEKIGFSNA